MTTTVAAPLPVTAAVQKDRLFYSGMAIAMAATVFSGFARTYYLQLFGQGPTATITGMPFTPLVHLHGIAFSAWVVLFIAQTSLVAVHRVRVHQRLGIAGGVLAAAMIVIGTSTAIAGAARGSAPPGVDPLAFLAVPLFDMALFATFIGAALWNRRTRETHKRLMLLAYVSILAAATARLPGVLPLGPFAFFGMAAVFLAVAIAYDYLSRQRVHPVYVWGGALFVLSVPARLTISDTAGWRALAEFLTRSATPI